MSTRPAGPGSPPGLSPLPSAQRFREARGPAAGPSLLAAAFAAVYLVTCSSGFRGGGRTVAGRPHAEGDVLAGRSGIAAAHAGAEAS